jgi:enoyl-CoA hydratase/carnithine racemase
MKLRLSKLTDAVGMSAKFLVAAAFVTVPAITVSMETNAAEKVSRSQEVETQPGQEHTQIKVEKRTPAYWRVTFDNPPFNIFGPETIPQMEKVVAAIEADPDLRVVVFDSAVPGFFLTHYNFTPPLAESTGLPSGPTGLHPLPDMLVRISKSPVVSIALIRGRATGVGSELALASDMRFASRQNAILSQWEVGAALVPGGGPMARLPRLMGRGRALEVLLGSDDINGDLAEKYGYVNRSFDDDKLDPFVDALATRISGFRSPGNRRHQAAGRFRKSPERPGDRGRLGRLHHVGSAPGGAREHRPPNGDGLQTDPEIEARLGHYTQSLAEK